MKCMYCGYSESKVIDSRATDDDTKIRRRRECLGRGRRFTTYEVVETIPVLVVKNDGTRQPFDRNKILSGIIKACEKRHVSMRDIEGIVNDIEKQINNSMEQEILSSQIGEMVMRALMKLDEVAYIRFASVYWQFEDLSAFTRYINEFKKTLKGKKDDAGKRSAT